MFLIIVILFSACLGVGFAYDMDFKEACSSPDAFKKEVSAVFTSLKTDLAGEEEEEEPKEEVKKAPKPDPLKEKLSEMTLEEKVGQMFILRFPSEGLSEDVKNYHPAGFVLFEKDFKNKSRTEVQDMIGKADQSNIPMLFAVDEEGGSVNRVSTNPALSEKPFPSPKALTQSGDMEAVKEDTLAKCALLKDLGINVNFAPVADVSTHPSDFIHERALGKEAEATAEYIKTVVREMKGSGVASTLKHFPGYGSNRDTHKGSSKDERGYESFRDEDYLPFEAGIEEGCDLVMVSHNIVTCMDPNLPASLSPAVHTELRDVLGFKGVIITDDLSMNGITSLTGGESPAVLAVLAGNDLLCSTDYEKDYPAVLQAAKEGKIAEKDIDASVLRILKLKDRLGLL